MRRSNRTWLAGGLMLIGAIGCDRSTNSDLPPAHARNELDRDGVNVQAPRRDVQVDTGPGGVDVDVNGTHPSTGKKVGVDVTPGGRVDVNVNGPAIREGIQERRAERTGE